MYAQTLCHTPAAMNANVLLNAFANVQYDQERVAMPKWPSDCKGSRVKDVGLLICSSPCLGLSCIWLHTSAA